MIWVQCEHCKSEYAVSDEDDPNDWDEPCEFCGKLSWSTSST
jgi:hypothetical protein